MQKQQSKIVERTNEACNDSRTGNEEGRGRERKRDPLTPVATVARGFIWPRIFDQANHPGPSSGPCEFAGKTDDIAAATKHLVNVTGH